MPRPAWSVGLRTNSDGSGGTTPNNYADFGYLDITVSTGGVDRADGSNSSMRVAYRDRDSHNGKVLDEFVIFK